jgi:hypothetical protein
MLGQVTHTPSGDQVVQFEDGAGNQCSVQRHRVEYGKGLHTIALLIGVDVTEDGQECPSRMVMTYDQVKELVRVLRAWVRTGHLSRKLARDENFKELFK